MSDPRDPFVKAIDDAAVSALNRGTPLADVVRLLAELSVAWAGHNPDSKCPECEALTI